MKKTLIVLMIISFLFLCGFTPPGEKKNEVIDNEYDELTSDQVFSWANEDVIYKDSSSILLASTIFQLTRSNISLKVNNEVEYSNFVVSIGSDGYTGNGAKEGTYTLVLAASVNVTDNGHKYFLEYTHNVDVTVIKNLGVCYIYNGNFYVYKSMDLAQSQITLLLKMLGKMPNSEVYGTYTSNYFSRDKENAEDSYDVTYTFESAAGFSGSGSFKINLIESQYQSNVETDNTDVVNGIVIAIVIVVAIGGIIFLIRKSTYKKRYKRSF